MLVLILGLLLGGCLAALFGFLLSFVIDEVYSRFWEKVLGVIRIIAIVASIVGCAAGMCFAEWHISTAYIDTYSVEKQTIELSISNPKLSGIERIELVKQASEANKKLASYQYDCKQWYSFNINDRILELEFIDLS